MTPASLGTGMHAARPLQFSVTGGSVAVVVLALLGGALSAILGGMVAYRAYRGYRRTGDRRLLALGAGIFLLATGSIALQARISVETPTGGVRLAIPGRIVPFLVTGIELIGLGCILWAIYSRPGSRRAPLAKGVGALVGVVVLVARARSFDVPLWIATMPLVTALVGSFVAYQAYRGYRRNGSRAMLFIGIGVFLLAIASFVGTSPVILLHDLSDGLALLAAFALRNVGSIALLYALTRA